MVCSESHFSVLFSPSALPRGLPLDLLLYDGLANQEAQIRLTVTQGYGGVPKGDEAEGRHIPPLEHVIHTRWPGVMVSWNGSEPLL